MVLNEKLWDVTKTVTFPLVCIFNKSHKQAILGHLTNGTKTYF